MSVVTEIARLEFLKLTRQPFVLLTTLLLCLMMGIEIAGNTILMPVGADGVTIGHFIEASLRNSWWYTTFFFSFLALCIGIITVSGERSSGTLRVLLTKPLYRRDIIVGKIAGISSFFFTLIAMVIGALALFILMSINIMNYPGSFDMYEFLLRIMSCGLLLFAYCIVTLGIMMLVGVALKNLLYALIFAFSYFYFALFYGMDFLGKYILINPYYLYAYTFNANGIILEDMTVPFASWLNAALPNIILMLLEAIGIILLACVIFNREEI